MNEDKLKNERGGEDDLPDEDLVAFRSTLRRLKSEGCNLLVVGDPPREVFARASQTMLGDPDARRWWIFGLTDASPESVYDRLPAASAAPGSPAETTKIIDYAIAPRQLTDSTDSHVAPISEVTVGDGNLDAFRAELEKAIGEFGEQSYRPAEVRVAVDSLAPLFDCYDIEVVRRFVRKVGARVREYDAMAHYVLPEPYDSARCQSLTDEFDVVVELRVAPEDADHDTDERSSSSDQPPADIADGQVPSSSRPGSDGPGEFRSPNDRPEADEQRSPSNRPETDADESDSPDGAKQSLDAEERWHLPETDTTMPWIPL